MSIVSKIFGTYSDHQLRKAGKIADRIRGSRPTYKDMGDEELRGMTQVFRNRLVAGETLDDISRCLLPLSREADDRVLGKRPFHVQRLAALSLHGRIAEMKTGEGKTLVATMPAYLNAHRPVTACISSRSMIIGSARRRNGQGLRLLWD